MEPHAAWAEACCTIFVDASNKGVSIFVGELEVAGCKLELADAAAVDAEKKRKEKKRKNYASRRQFNEKLSIILGCPGRC